jgi:hypothetical protein
MNFGRWRLAFLILAGFMLLGAAAAARSGHVLPAILDIGVAVFAAYYAGDANGAAKWLPLLDMAIRTLQAANTQLRADQEKLALANKWKAEAEARNE